MRISIVFTAALVVFAAVVQADDAEENYLTLEIAAQKSTFVLYEPIVLTASVRNPTSHDIPTNLVMRGSPTPVTILITRPDGSKTKYVSGSQSDILSLGVRPQAGGEVRSADIVVYWNSLTDSLAFGTPGEYSIEAQVVTTRTPRVTTIVAEAITISVVPPTATEVEAIDYLGAEEVLVELLRDGPSSYCKKKEIVACHESVRAFLESHARSAYSPSICRELVVFVLAGLVEATPQMASGIELANRCLELWPNHAETPRTTEFLIRMLIADGRTEDAELAIGEFGQTWPDRQDIVSQLNRRLEQ